MPVRGLVYHTTRATEYHTPPVGLGCIVAGKEWVGVSATVLDHAPLLSPES